MSRTHWHQGIKFVLLHTLAIFFTASTYVAGAIPLMVVRNNFGRLAYLASSALVAAAFFYLDYTFMACLWVCLSLLVGFYTEMEEGGLSTAAAGLLSVLFVTGISAFFSSMYIQYRGLNLLATVKAKILEVLTQLREINPGFQLEIDTIVAQLPSGVLMGFILALSLAIIFYRPMAQIFRLEPNEARRTNLLTFELPDICVWITIAGIALVGLTLPSENYRLIGLNLLNLMVVLYFFQGLAVIFSFFRTYRISVFWQTIWLFLLVVQLFVLVSLIGFIDYWLDLRKRMYKRVAPTKIDKRV